MYFSLNKKRSTTPDFNRYFAIDKMKLYLKESIRKCDMNHPFLLNMEEKINRKSELFIKELIKIQL